MRMMLRMCLGLGAAALLATGASAVPVTFTEDSLSVVGGTTPATVSLAGAPIIGSGDLTFDASGNLLAGSLSLGSFTVNVDLLGDTVLDAAITTTGWTQTLAAATNSGGNVILAGGTAGGASSCSQLTAFGALVCPSVSPTVQPFGVGGTATQTNTTTMTLTSFVSPTQFSGTIASVTVDSSTGATTTLGYSFAAVPEPSTALLLGAGLLGLGALGRRRV